MNTAAYLREDSLYKKKQADEVKVIEAYESELRDSTEYYTWQTEMREKDLKGRREQVERVRMLAKLSADEAQQAMEKQRSDNAEIASRIKTESIEMQKQMAFEAEMNKLMNRQLVKEVIEVREHAPKEAQERMLEQRKERRTEIRDEMHALLAETKEEEQRQQAAREERVRKLKAELEVHEPRTKIFDPTESIGIGLLDEMSFLEMKERYTIMKKSEEEREKGKRRGIVEAKHKQQLNLRKRIQNIERFRASAMQANKETREKRRLRDDIEAASRESERNTANLRLLGELDAKRLQLAAGKKILQEEEERRLATQAFGGQGLHAAEETHFSELLRGAERGAQLRQEEAQKAAKVYEETKQIGISESQRNMKRYQFVKRRQVAQNAEEIERNRKELVRNQRSEISSKKSAFLEQRLKHKMVKEKIVSLNPYANTLTEASRSKREKARPQFE